MNYFAAFNEDPIEGLIQNAGTVVRTSEKTTGHVEKCPKCRGTGRFVAWSGRVLGPCHACKGAGSKTFKNSPEARAAGRAKVAARKERNADENWAAFAKQEPEVAAWIQAEASRFAFASSMLDAVRKYEQLTDNQLAAVWRCIEKNKTRVAEQAARKAEAEARAAAAPEVDTAGISRLKEAFDTAATRARTKGLTMRSPKITIAGLVISPAKAESKNPGALYVKLDGAYMGKIIDNRFLGVRECTPEIEARVLAFIADPKAAAEAYGQTTGTCCICNATLKSAWKLRGIGPICAEKFGW